MLLSGRQIKTDIDWLDNLIPRFRSGTSGWISLAALLTDMGMHNSTGTIVEWVDVNALLETVVAALMTDGMSQQDYAGGSSGLFSEALGLL